MADFKPRGFSHIIYPVTDMDTVIKFFTEALGFYFQRYSAAIDEAYVGFGDTLLNLTHHDQNPNRSVYEFGLTVDDMDLAIKHLESHGAVVSKAVWEGRSFWGRQVVMDIPGGAPIALREWRSGDGPHFMDWSLDGEPK